MALTSEHRLARNFHRTFKPERTYLAAMLRYAAAGNSGSMEAISDRTGIPTGASSGKVKPTIDYCTGMGLLRARQTKGEFSFALTPFGRVVLREDRYFKSRISQWLAQLQLCHPLTGADLWYQIFVQGAAALGNSFSRADLEAYLRKVYATNGRNPVGPVLRACLDETSLGFAGPLVMEGEQIRRVPVPHDQEMQRGLAAWLAQLLFDCFPETQQIPLSLWEERCGWIRAAAWHPATVSSVLAAAEQLGVLRVDRHMQPWLVDLCRSPDEIWDTIFADVL